MKHIDPASQEFEKLSRPEQARIYYSLGWTRTAIADELEASKSTVGRWLNPEMAKREGMTRAAWRRTERGQEIRKQSERRRYARLKAMKGNSVNSIQGAE